MIIRVWQLFVIPYGILILYFFMIDNTQPVSLPLSNQSIIVIALFCILLFYIAIIETVYIFFPRRKPSKRLNSLDLQQRTNYIYEENSLETKKEKKWYVLIGFVFVLILGLTLLWANTNIVAPEANFNTSAESIEKMTSYITVEGDSNKYYKTYTSKGPESIQIWVETPKDNLVKGILKIYFTNYDAVVDRNSWIGVTETPFSTNIKGGPISLASLDANSPPGIYVYEFIVEGKLILKLKYII